MKRTILWALALSLVLCACAPASAPSSGASPSPAETSTVPSAKLSEAPSPTAVTILDDLDREVEVPYQPKRVAILLGSFVDIWCKAGGRDSVVSAVSDTWTSFDLDLPDGVTDLGGITEPNVELLFASEPELILASSNTSADMDLLPTLEDSGIPTVYFGVNSFEDYLPVLERCCQITGQPDCYEQYGVQVQQQVEDARARAKASGQTPTVLLVRVSSTNCKTKNSVGTVLGEMLADLGCINIADSETSLLDALSMEIILKEDPDHIFVVFQGSDTDAAQRTLESVLYSDPAWNSLTAVKEGRVHLMDRELYHLKPNERWGEAYEGVCEILYG